MAVEVLRFIIQGPVLLLAAAIGFLWLFMQWGKWYDRHPRAALTAGIGATVMVVASAFLLALMFPY